MPNGRRLKANLPKGVMKVVSSLDSSQRGNCQKLLFTSNSSRVLLDFRPLTSWGVSLDAQLG